MSGLHFKDQMFMREAIREGNTSQRVPGRRETSLSVTFGSEVCAWVWAYHSLGKGYYFLDKEENVSGYFPYIVIQIQQKFPDTLEHPPIGSTSQPTIHIRCWSPKPLLSAVETHTCRPACQPLNPFLSGRQAINRLIPTNECHVVWN